MGNPLPAIPAKRYFTIGEVGELCDVKPHVLRYWEQEFAQLRPMKRRGNRRYYQHHEVLMIRRIRGLLYEEGFTISGARNKLHDWMQAGRGSARAPGDATEKDALRDEGSDHGDQGVRSGGAVANRNGAAAFAGTIGIQAGSDAAAAPFAARCGVGHEVLPTESFVFEEADHAASGDSIADLPGLRRELFEIRALLEAVA